MTEKELLQHRLHNLDINAPRFKKTEQMAAWLGGIQAQDYGQAKWAIGSRIPGSTNESIDKAISSQTIVRTWMMRGTIHVVSPDDIQWLTDLLAPRIIARNKTRYRQLELNEKTLDKANDILGKALDSGDAVTRTGISEILKDKKIIATGVRLAHILQYACLKNTICFSAKQGKDFSFTKLKPSKKSSFSREQALAELATRYFSSHGPASVKDFIWWSGLAPEEARKGMESIKSRLEKFDATGDTYFTDKDVKPYSKPDHRVHLLAGFDEYIVGYTNRSVGMEQKHISHVIRNNGIFYPTVILDGFVKGIWKPVVKKDSLHIEIQRFSTFSKSMEKDVKLAASRYADFVGKKLSESGF